VKKLVKKALTDKSARNSKALKTLMLSLLVVGMPWFGK